MTIHLHTPMGRTYCNAPVPTDRARGLTAYASEATCPACIATLTPRQMERRAAREAEALAAREAHARDYAARYVAACEARDIAAGVLPALTRLASPVQYAYAYSAAIGPCDGHGIHAACTIRD